MNNQKWYLVYDRELIVVQRVDSGTLMLVFLLVFSCFCFRKLSGEFWWGWIWVVQCCFWVYVFFFCISVFKLPYLALPEPLGLLWVPDCNITITYQIVTSFTSIGWCQIRPTTIFSIFSSNTSLKWRCRSLMFKCSLIEICAEMERCFEIEISIEMKRCVIWWQAA